MKKIFLVYLFISVTINAADIKEDAERIINEFFNRDVKLIFVKYQIPQQDKIRIENDFQQRFFKDYVYLWKVYDGEKQIATAILDNVYGKSLPITFLVIFDLEGKIIDTEIVRYREQYGGAVQEKKWLKQFTGKSFDSQFKVGKDVSSISGATISAKSIAVGIKKLTILYSLIKEKI